MRRTEAVRLLIRAAELSGRTEFVVIGSRAAHGSNPDAQIAAVLGSPDIDLYPRFGYGHPMTWENLVIELGIDSNYHLETGTYIEPVRAELAKFPAGWEDRIIRERSVTF